MFTVELYAKIRHAVMVDRLSRREAAKRFGVHRNTITKMLSFSVPPGYRRRERPASKKLGPYMAWIDAILEGDRRVHKKQRHTAHRIFERLRDEQRFAAGYTIVREYVAQAMLRAREMFVPLSDCPGHAQADFGEADGYIGGKKVRFHYFCMDLPHSDGCFVKGVSGRNGGSFLRWLCRGLRLLRRRAAIDSLRQHQTGGCQDREGRTTAALENVCGAATSLPVRRPFRAAGERKRQGQGGRSGQLCPAQFHDAIAGSGKLRCAQCQVPRCLRQAPSGKAARPC